MSTDDQPPSAVRGLARYVHRPTEVRAVRHEPGTRPLPEGVPLEPAPEGVTLHGPCASCEQPMADHVWLRSVYGDRVLVHPGDFVVQGARPGDWYPAPSDVFERSYEPAGAADPASHWPSREGA